MQLHLHTPPAQSPSFLSLTFISFLLLLSLRAPAQILVQDFERLGSLSEFSQATNPSAQQVNVLLQTSTDGNTTFSLASLQGRRVLRLSKESNNQVYWIKDQGFETPAVMRLQFDLSTSAPGLGAGQTVSFGSFFVGRDLSRDRNFPEYARRFASVELRWAGPDRFRIENRVNNTANGGHTAASGTTISIFLNNSGGAFTYLAPNGLPETIPHQGVDIWAGQALVVNDAPAQAAVQANPAPLQEIKFVTRNTNATGLADFDNFLIESVPAYIPPPALNPAGGTYTVGVGGDFSSLTRTGGVFHALNQLQAINGPFVFEVISHLPDETGEHALNELSGASAQHTISIRPRPGNTPYQISGSSDVARGALIRLNGADWVRLDGRSSTNGSSGLQVPEGLLFRNTGTAPTIGLERGATHVYLGYCLLQGRSSDPQQGVIFLNGTAGGNSHATIEYNEIGGYEEQYPVNALASRSAENSPNEAVLVQGNEFYSFGAKGSASPDYPSELLLGPGSTNWTIDQNHFYLRQATFTHSSSDVFSLRGIRILSGTDYTIRQNYFGGQQPFAGGAPLHIITTSPQQAYASILPLSFESPQGAALFEHNRIANITAETSATPLEGDALALSAVAYAGRVDFVKNEFYGLTAISTGQASVLQGGYAIIPIQFRNRPALQTAGSVVGNRIEGVLLKGNRSGAGGSYLTFRGIFIDSQANVPDIRDNSIRNIAADVSGRLGADLIGIVYRGTAAQARIERNMICDLRNGSSFGEAVAISPLLYGSTGIYTQHVSGGLLIANNMLALATPQAQSTTSLHGLYLNSAAQQPVKVYYNTLYMYGPGNASARTSHLLRREGSAPIDIKNNILLDTRATEGVNYLIYSRLSSGISSNHNLLYQAREVAPYPDFGYIAGNSAANLPQWQQMTLAAGGQSHDLASISQNVERYFVDPQACNLRILETLSPQSPTIDAGTELADVGTDIDQVVRINPDMGASEAFNAWIGVQDSRWDNPANWSRGQVPDCEANNLVGVLPNGTRIWEQTVRFQPQITSPNAYYRNLVVLEGASVTIGSANALLQQCGLQNPLLEGITNRGAIQYTAPGEIRLMGVLRNEGNWQAGQGTLTLNGAARQTINSTAELEIWRLRLTGGGDKRLEEIQTLSVRHSLVLEEGVLYSSEESLLSLGPDAAVDGNPSNTAYISGPMLKHFSRAEDFVFPVGDAGRLGQVAVITEQDRTTSFKVAYHAEAAPVPTDPAAYPAAFEEVAQVSEQEYWTVQQLGGSAAAQLALYWDEQSGIAEVAEEDLLVARWSRDDSRWRDEGNDGMESAADPEEGRLRSAPGLSSFGNQGGDRGIFTFGTTNPQAPLPVTLISFDAALRGKDVVLQWRTATEEGNSHFLVQRSRDGVDFTTLGSIASKAAEGNSQQELAYTFSDVGVAEVLAGPLYYRLEQVDIDGSREYSPVVLVQLSNPHFTVNGIYPNPFTHNLVVNLQGSRDQQVQLRVLHSDGRLLAEQQLHVQKGETIMPIGQLQHLPAGLYVLEITAGTYTSHHRLVKK
ncbi:T9SS type A sorting domain-containing protein [Cesiribacter andamanensis]|uniref:Secretion system C-terminal sorting domain-containing protein n=1 Tax=Cesiribacter andamanensis AMV16 TaxID=1279009 RepID=M7NQW2_9BACT|nr:T9SS type A sorting domain-containing protein [Cesiribacter andamanensis]EMR04105.1 hypothetical protein ADICEAN_00728 [Cesiribacter andamanensis AMV16]